jgi:uncharacterized membrane protein YfcA
LEAITIAVFFGAFLAAGLVKGVIGLGLPTIALALLTPVIGLHDAITAVILPALATNVWQALAGGSLKDLLGRFWPMLVAICLGVALGSWVLVAIDARTAARFLGAVLALYALSGLFDFRPRARPEWEPALASAVGLSTGVITGITGTFAVPSVMYLQAQSLDRNRLVQAMGMTFLTATLSLGLALGGHGIFKAGTGLLSIAALLPAAGGMWLGQKLRERISEAAFRVCLLLGLLLIALHLMLR